MQKPAEVLHLKGRLTVEGCSSSHVLIHCKPVILQSKPASLTKTRLEESHSDQMFCQQNELFISITLKMCRNENLEFSFRQTL